MITEMEPGCMDNIPIRELASFLTKWGLAIVNEQSVLKIVKKEDKQ
jgi:hypothetical protein